MSVSTMQPKYLSARNPSDALPTTVDVIIIGAGPAGAAAAWALDRAQPGIRTLVIERAATVGAGSSRASLENFRTCWPTACLARMMQRSVHIFLHADDYLGDGAFEALHPKQRGYLWCGFNDAHAAGFQADVAHLNAMDIDVVTYLDADEVAYRFPWLGRRVIAAKHDPTAGWLDSNALIQRYLQSASGAQVLLDAGDVKLCIDGGRVTGVTTAAGTIRAPAVVLAAGAWATEIASAADLWLPIILRPRQSFTTGWRHEAFPDDAPMLIGSAPFPHVRPEARSGAIFGWEYRWHRKYAPLDELRRGKMHPAPTEYDDALRTPVPSIDTLKDPRFPSITLALLARQFGHTTNGFADGRYLRNLYHNIGYYVYRGAKAAYRVEADGTRTPYESERAILDAHPDVAGLYLSIAHSGHGIMSSPCAGEIIAAKVLGQPLADSHYSDFGIDVAWVAHDENAL
ncbi:MAG: FAD-binding oxidoreductase [Chloroflexota bacterium]|nr:FAD-binding oxidoreductase [Chloroflexota bacterium]